MSQLRLVYVRHGEKAYANGKGPLGTYRFDPGLKIEDDSRLVKLGEHLTNSYGVPGYCVTSPYRRCRQTSLLLLKDCDEKSRPKDLIVDVSIGEFLGNQKTQDIRDLDPLTAQYRPSTAGETFEHLIVRCYKHLTGIGFTCGKTEVTPPPDTGKDETIWIVTHGVVMQELLKILNKMTQKPLIQNEPRNFVVTISHGLVSCQEVH